MAYTTPAEDVKTRKEFLLCRNVNDKNPDYGPISYELSSQRFAITFISPYNTNRRVNIKSGTGQGKTFTSLAAAYQFVPLFNSHYMATGIRRYVYVLGFSADIFIKELTTNPYFKFVKTNKPTVDEKAKAIRKINNSCFRFVGYKKFNNRLFKATKDLNKNIDKMTYQEIKDAIDNKQLIVNRTLLDEMKDSVLICDEVHLIYNSLADNNWGASILFVLYEIPEIYAIFLSATPIEHSPHEIVSILNLLNSKEDRVSISDLFIGDTYQLKPDAENKIRKLIEGKILYVIDINEAEYPSLHYAGDTYDVNLKSLKYVSCRMTGFQLEVYKKLDDELGRAADRILPSPDKSLPGLHRGKDMILLSQADAKWKSTNGVDYDVKTRTISGSFMHVNNLQQYSCKYHKALSDVLSIIKAGESNGKMLIFHNEVKVGVLFIAQIFRENGFIGVGELPLKTTICKHCGIQKMHHNDVLTSSSERRINRNYTNSTGTTNNGSSNLSSNLLLGKSSTTSSDRSNSHIFTPARYITLFSESSSIVKGTSMAANLEKFENSGNIEGNEIVLAIGARVILQSINFTGIRHIFIVSLPLNMSMMIQLIGRGVRKGSHNKLTPNNRNVTIHIYINVDSIENESFKNKTSTYLSIQKLDKIMNENAVDSFINKNIIQPSIKNNQFILPYTITHEKIDPSKIIKTTHNAYFIETELFQISNIIKYGFYISRVQTFEEIVSYVKNCKREVDGSLYDEENIAVALNRMMYTSSVFSIKPYIFIPKVGNCIIKKYGPYYIAFNQDMEYEDSIYRDDLLLSKNDSINLTKLVEDRKLNKTFDIMFQEFYMKYKNIKIVDMLDMICDLDVNFHTQLAEIIIEYFFKRMMKLKITHNKYDADHIKFFKKVLFYYDSLGLIIWASTCDPSVYDLYKNHVKVTKTIVDTTSKTIKRSNITEDKKESFIRGVNNMDNKDNIRLQVNSYYDELYRRSNGMLGIDKSGKPQTSEWYTIQDPVIKSNYKNKVDTFERVLLDSKLESYKPLPYDYVLPVGHNIGENSKYFHISRDWFSQSRSKIIWQENPIIIGFNVKVGSNALPRFKLRNPVVSKDKQHVDKRLHEKGGICSSKSKPELVSIAKSLGITLSKGLKTEQLCMMIKKELINREINERKKGTNIKWYYLCV